MRRFLALTLIAAFGLTSCGTESIEDRVVNVLAQSICVANDAYTAIQAAKTSTSSGALVDLRQKAEDFSKKMDDLRNTAFGSGTGLAEIREQLKDKKLVAQRAIEEAKKKCAPSQAAIDQATKDYQ